jgi:hypothetical protein
MHFMWRFDCLSPLPQIVAIAAPAPTSLTIGDKVTAAAQPARLIHFTKWRVGGTVPPLPG